MKKKLKGTLIIFPNKESGVVAFPTDISLPAGKELEVEIHVKSN